jgi:hypothetical protein
LGRSPPAFLPNTRPPEYHLRVPDVRPTFTSSPPSAPSSALLPPPPASIARLPFLAFLSPSSCLRPVLLTSTSALARPASSALLPSPRPLLHPPF